jgi:hypothetical protein
MEADARATCAASGKKAREVMLTIASLTVEQASPPLNQKDG